MKLSDLFPCEYCGEQNKPFEDENEFEEYTLRITKITPLPAINLTTGEVSKHADPPYYSLFLYNEEDEKGGERASFPILFCPKCGRRLWAKS